MHIRCMQIKPCTPSNAILSWTWQWHGCWSCRAVHEREHPRELCSTSHVHETFTHQFVQGLFCFSVVFVLGSPPAWTLCTHIYTLTNRKWCQSLSPGRQRRLLRYRDSGFLFLSFSSAPLSHGLTQIDTSPSVAGVHPSHPLITGRPSEPGLASLYLPLSRSLSLHLHLSASISLY